MNTKKTQPGVPFYDLYASLTHLMMKYYRQYANIRNFITDENRFKMASIDNESLNNYDNCRKIIEVQIQ